MTDHQRPYRLPLEPLLTQAELRLGVEYSIVAAADLIGTAPRQLHRWIDADGLPLHAAEIAAHRLGLTVHLLWPDEYAASCPP